MLRPAGEQLGVGLGRADHPAEQPAGHDVGEVGHHVEPVVVAVEALGHEGPGALAQRLDAAHGEPRADRPAQPLVVGVLGVGEGVVALAPEGADAELLEQRVDARGRAPGPRKAASLAA